MSKDKQRMGNNNIKFGALLIVALFIGSAATFAVSMADAATSSEYIVGKDFRGKTFVKNDRGRIVQSSYDSARMIQYAIDRAPQGTSIKIDKGEYTLRNSINSKTGVTISGAGNETVLKNGQILIQTSNVIITSLRMEGTCHLVIMPDRVPIQNIIVRNISATLGKVESAFSVITNKYDVSDITFSHNIVLNSGSSGFLLSGNAQITDISIESCNVVNSGINSRYNDWVSGFILAQHAPVKNMLVANCEASNNWENGFFLKPEMKKDNVILKDCIANNNGRKAKFSEGYGYYLDESVAMIRCIGEGNGGGLSNLAQLPDPEPAPERIPEISKIILEIDDMKANVGSTLKITGTLMGTTGVSGAKVMVKIVDPNGVSINPIRGGTVTTDNEGKFAVNYKPPMVGAYIFVATFSGSEDYSKSDASMLFNAVAIVPEPEPVLKGSKITLTQSDMSVEIGETFTISGILSDGIGIARATVSIKIVYSDGTTTHSFGEDKVITDRYGRFSMTYMPDRIGDYMITATFVGDNSHTASSASLSFGAIDLLPDDPVLDTVTYDYVVSNNVVRSSSGTIVYTGNSFTTALQWAVKQTGKIIYVLSGTYYVTGTLSMASGSTLIGDGEAETVF
ncbi:MAG: carboxypeptidase regulatory-like domain-containing protein, partial [Euryarchaeota archaeon]|nr:carboxypeptidase regulatory-like domain-containing protein [Euryarchaeota archaeon]